MDYIKRDGEFRTRDTAAVLRSVVAVANDDGTVTVTSDTDGSTLSAGTDSDGNTLLAEVTENGDQNSIVTLPIPLVDAGDVGGDEPADEESAEE